MNPLILREAQGFTALLNMSMSDEFTGFPREAFTFWTRLAKNNNRDWFQANKDMYERACRQPLQALVDELKPLYGAGKISRINRDMRFARDKSPYKNYIAAGVGNSYISLSKQGVWVGTGMYKPEPAALARFRAAVADDESGAALAQLVRALRRKGYDVSTHDTLSSAPKGYEASHPRIELLRMKDIYAGKTLPPGMLASPKALERVTRVMREPNHWQCGCGSRWGDDGDAWVIKEIKKPNKNLPNHRTISVMSLGRRRSDRQAAA